MTAIDMSLHLPYPAGQPYSYAVEVWETYESDVQAQLAKAIVAEALDAVLDRDEIDLDQPMVNLYFETELSGAEVRERIAGDPVLSKLELAVYGD